ncbi:hypothetical protein MRB53_008146 [Persea americana]|uniref:Uncharacterized protein n=1 Tax=Persea americana TaxID=3435 RepID=A0ACC2MLK5_PERAE|nr:hypothetical protein MRB53_008146 [Persea americana]
MQSLRKLDLGYTNLFASIDSLRGLCELKNLRALYLDSNNLDGRALPPCLSNLSKLEEMWLSGNDLGSYSSALTGLKKLWTLNLDSNHLTDDGISPWISNLKSLTELSLQRNKLKGSDTMRGVCGLSSLRELYLQDNYLSSLPICMGNFSLLEKLELSENNLTSLFGNSISGLKRLQELDLGWNQLTDDGISPWISNLTSLAELYLGNNKLKGADTMRGVCGLSSLRELYLHDNYLSSLPICMGNFSLLEKLDLSENNLTSLFGNSISGLKRLESLDLGWNHLTDDGISPWISNLTSLTYLCLGNNKLKGADTMRGLKRLESLDLGWNQLTDDSISPWISNLTSLTYLRLENNKLKESDTMRGLKRLQELYLGWNQLTDDSISPWISNLTSLAELYLGNNKLKGSDTIRGPGETHGDPVISCGIYPKYVRISEIASFEAPDLPKELRISGT